MFFTCCAIYDANKL